MTCDAKHSFTLFRFFECHQEVIKVSQLQLIWTNLFTVVKEKTKEKRDKIKCWIFQMNSIQWENEKMKRSPATKKKKLSFPLGARLS